MAAKRNDLLWKGILEDVFDDFLRFMIPAADNIFDFSKGITFLDKELEQLYPPEADEFSPKVVDKLAQVYTLEGKEEWILCHVEIQSLYRSGFSRRMYTYYARILDKYDRSIAAFVIFTEASIKIRSDTYEREYLGTSLRYKFNTYQVASQDLKELSKSNNPFAIVLLTAKSIFQLKNIEDATARDQLLLDLKRPLVRNLLSKEIPKKKVRVLMNFLRYYVRFDTEEYNVKFEREVEVLTENTNTMGIEELLLEQAKNKGMIEERAKVEAEKLEEKLNIARQFKNMGLSSTDIAKGTGLSVEEVEKL